MKGDGALDRYALRRLVRQAGERLKAAGVASPEHDARELAEWILGTRLPLVDGADEAFAATYEEVVRRRAAREPLQRITGRMFFRGLELECRPGVFIVRPETEVVAGVAIEAVLARERGGVAGGPLVVDLCTGSGAIAAAVATEVPTARVIAVELADEACAATVATCEWYAPGRVRVLQADAAAPSTLADLDGSVDVVVTNPCRRVRSRTWRPCRTTPVWRCSAAGRMASPCPWPSCAGRERCCATTGCSSWSTTPDRDGPCARRPWPGDSVRPPPGRTSPAATASCGPCGKPCRRSRRR